MRKLGAIIAIILGLCAGDPAFAANNPSLVPHMPTIAAMQALGPAASQYTGIIADGYLLAGDGGGGYFSWVSNSTTTANPCTIFAATGIATGRFVRQWDNLHLPVADCGVFPGAGTSPSGWSDQYAGIVAALNATNGTAEVEFECGPYKVSGDILAGTTAPRAMLKSCAPAFASGDANPRNPGGGDVVISPSAGSTFNQTPNAWQLSNYTVLYSTGTGIFGSPDTVSAYGYSNKLSVLDGFVVWNGGGNTALFGAHIACQNTTIKNNLFVMYAYAGIFLEGGGDNCDIGYNGGYDAGYFLGSTGSFGTRPTWCQGAFIWVGQKGSPANTDYQSYCGLAAANPIYYTQLRIHDNYAWQRNYSLINAPGYGGMVLMGASGDVGIDNFQSIMGILGYQSIVVENQLHIESFASNGTSVLGDCAGSELWYDSQVNRRSGWLGAGDQAHNCSTPVYYLGNGSYTPNTSGPSNSIDLTPQHPTLFGTAWRNQICQISQNTAAGQGGTDTFTCPSVFPDGYGFDGTIIISIVLRTNLSVFNSQMFHLAVTKQSTTYSPISHSIDSVLTSTSAVGGNLATTFAITTSGNGTTTSQGQNLQGQVTYTGTTWATGLPVTVTMSGYGAFLPSN